jgi:hypothetical protein
MDDNLLREIDDDVRRERMLALWHKFRKPLLSAIILAVLITAGSSIYREYTNRQNAAFTRDIFAAMRKYDSKQWPQAAESFADLATKQSGNKQQIALLWQSRALRADQQTDKAVEILQKIAQIKDGDALWHDQACIDLIGIQHEIPKQCGLSKNSPLINELRAAHAAALWQQGQLKQAQQLLGKITADATAPPLLKDQSRQWQQTIKAQPAVAPQKVK